jgi:TetR/AcrR family transcriptional regulator
MRPAIPARTERADQSRARILEAAVRQFSEYGLAGARTEQIAEAAGVNKALLYYYFKGKEDLYAAALESVIETMQAASFALLESDGSVGERFVRLMLTNFDRCYSFPEFQTLMQQEMVRLHRGEQNQLTMMAERFIRPMWIKLEEVLKEGIASGELIPVDPSQMRYAALGANIFYFLSAPLTRLAFGVYPMDRGELERRRKTVVEFLGQTIFIDRKHGARVAKRVLAAMPMPQVKRIKKRK